AVVQSTLLPTTHLWVQQEFEDEHGLFQLADLVQGASDLVLSWVGRQLAHDQRRGDGAMAYRSCQAEDLIPVVLDHARVDAIGEQLVERTVVILLRADREQALVEYFAGARRKPKPQRGAEPEHVRGVTGGIGE